MFLTFIIAFFSLMGLMILHEFGHFFLAKKFGVLVEEFGIGYPPRLFGKKIGETIYSLNLLPFGAFVKIYGENGESEGKKEDARRSFVSKPIWQRSLIILGGVISFWIVAIILLSIVMAVGAPTAIGDEDTQNLINPKVQITAIVSGSPAEIAGMQIGDEIKKISIAGRDFPVSKVKELQDFINGHKGEEIIFAIARGQEVFEKKAVPRVSPPEGEGPMGIALVRTAIKSVPWYRAPFEGILATVNLTAGVFVGWGQALMSVFQHKSSEVQVVGPVGIFSLFAQVSRMGAVYFLQFIAIISVYLAVFNILPIPVVDGGRLLFLGIEKIRKKPIPVRVEQGINSFFFTLLILLMVWVTIHDIARII